MKVWQMPWSVGVIIPAQNEESTIGKCIETVLAALAQAGISRAWVVVVADACTDRTVQVARQALGIRGETIEIDARSAGAARRVGAAAALLHLSDIDPIHIWLANTDGDSYVTSDWITVQLTFAEQGVTGVAGIVHLDMTGETAAHDIYRETYLTSAQGTHSHVHGANLSLRADAYLDVGGWHEIALAEDHCLWGRLRHRGWRTSSPISSVVITSPRLKGRAPGGFADTLKALVDVRRANA